MNIGRYEVIRELGKGGMAIVYLAYDPYIKRQVAVKVLPRQFTYDPQFRVRFQQEAQLIAALEHPYIVPIYDFGEHEDQPFIVMRYLPGGTLTQRLNDGALTVPEVVPLFENLASALDYAHRLGIIHRDIKPGNTLFDTDGKAHLSDFGIAKIQEANAAVTGTGSLVGTPAYMSPEQAIGAKVIDGRVDIYSLGVVLFQCLSGELPFKADTPMGLAIAHIQQPVPSLLALRPDLPPGFDGIIRKALEKDPAGRYQTGGEFARAIGQQARLLDMDVKASIHTNVAPVSYSGPSRGPAAGEPQGKSLPSQPGVEIVPASVPKKSAAPRVAGVLAILLSLGLIGGFASGLIPNPFASVAVTATTAATVAPSATPVRVTFSPSAAATEPATATQEATGTPTIVPTATLTATLAGPLTEFTDDTGIDMILVPAGDFTMGGNDLNAEPDERTVHPVILDDYYIDRFEVTNGAYQACVAAGACKPPKKTDSFTRSSYYGVPEYDDYPVVYVDWSMARNYCEWRGARLPTEAEWEKAARGAGDLRAFPWGTARINCQLANYDGPNGCLNGTNRVDSNEDGKSPYGVYGMAGNVWEWVADWYSETYYKYSPTRNPTGPDSGQSRVLRGGSWTRSEFDVRVSNRNKYGPTYNNFDIGFRCAREVFP
jgi:serine/threonine-protein kinase